MKSRNDLRTYAIVLLFTVSVSACAVGNSTTTSLQSSLSDPSMNVPLTPTNFGDREQPALDEKVPISTPNSTPARLPTESKSHEAQFASMTNTDPSLISEDNIEDLEPAITLEAHSAAVTDLAFSPDGSTFATSSEDGTVRLWRLDDGELLQTLQGHSDFVLSLDFSPDGTALASGSNDGTVRIWDASNGTLIQKIESYAMGRVLKVAYSPEGSYLAIANHLCYVQVRNAATGILYRTMVQPECAARLGGTVRAWGLDFTSDGEQIITGEGRPCCGGSLQSWQVDDAFTPASLLKGYNLQIRDLDIAPDDHQFAVALLGSSVFWLVDLQTGALLQTFEGHTYRVNSVAYSPDGALLVSGSRDQKVRLWRAADGTLLETLQGHESEVNCTLFTPDGSGVVSASEDGTVILWKQPAG